MISDFYPPTKKRKVDTDERSTPQSLFDECHEEFGFTIDVAATKQNAKLPYFLTKNDDALSLKWIGWRVWCNPPYSDITPWVAKAALFEADVAVLLVPSWTDRKWWHDYIKPYEGNNASVRFLPGRLKFGKPGSSKQDGAAPFGCALLMFEKGKRP